MSLCTLTRPFACSLAVLGLTLLGACGTSDSGSASNGGAAGAAPVAPPTPSPIVSDKPAEVPVPVAPLIAAAAAAPTPSAIPTGPTAYREALQALEQRDFFVVCAYLEFEGFDPVVCDYFAKRAGGQPASLSSSTLERLLRAQNVARRSGTIVGWFEEPRSYEARVNGRSSILEVVDTRFETTGSFTMWAMQMDDEELETNSGRIVNVPVYMEWPLADHMLDATRARGDDAAGEAMSLLTNLVESWSIDRRVRDDDVRTARTYAEWSAFLAQRRAGAQTADAEAAATDDDGQGGQGAAPAATTTSPRPRPAQRPREVSANAFE